MKRHLPAGGRAAQPLRIAMISEHASPLATMGGVDSGGQNVYVGHAARALARLGHEVEIFTRRDSPRLPACVDLRPGVRVRHVDAGPPEFVPKEQLLPHMPVFGTRLQRIAAELPAFDAVHANFFMSGLAGVRLKLSQGLPLVMTFHALGLVRREHQKQADAFPPERIDIERMLARRADAVIAECPQDRADLERLYGAPPSRITMVPCGIDVDEFRPQPQAAARAALGLEADEFVILQLGRMVPRKGVDNVIRALAELPARVRARARLLVVGGEGPDDDEQRTPELGRLRRLAQACGVADRVRFTGQRQRGELRAHYAAADVFVTTPWYEPFGITPLEAMACGTPVIGARVGGIAYSVEERVTGLLVPPKDACALAAALVELHDNPQLARAMGLAGVRRVRSLFTWDQVAAQLAQVYAQVRAPAPAARAPRRSVMQLLLPGPGPLPLYPAEALGPAVTGGAT